MVGTISCAQRIEHVGRVFAVRAEQDLLARDGRVQPAIERRTREGALVGARIVAQHPPAPRPARSDRPTTPRRTPARRGDPGRAPPATAARRHRRPRSRCSRETGRRRRTNAGRMRSCPAADAPAPPRRARRLQARAGGSARIRPAGSRAMAERKRSKNAASPAAARLRRANVRLPAAASICRPARTAPCCRRPPSPRRAAPTRRGPAAGRPRRSRFEPSLYSESPTSSASSVPAARGSPTSMMRAPPSAPRRAGRDRTRSRPGPRRSPVSPVRPPPARRTG